MAADGDALGLIERDIAHRRTARLVFRPVLPSDLKAAYALYSRPDVVRHRPDPDPDSRALVAARLEKEVRHWEKHGIGRWALLREGVVIGFGGLTHKPGFFGLNLSLHLHPAHWGQGLAQEFAAEALAVAFGPHRAQRVVCFVRPANAPALRVLDKAGFAKEAEVMLEGAPSWQFARDARGQFARDARGQFARDARGQFARDARGQFAQDAEGPLSHDARGPARQAEEQPTRHAPR